MIEITTLDGQALDLDNGSVLRVVGPLPHDVGPHTYVSGPTPAELVTAEAPEALLARLGLNPPLAQLTRPNGTPVWLKAAAVSAVRAPVPAEQQDPGTVNAVILLGSLHQAVHETVEAARAVINALGGHV
jgi:hypothetical protein